MNTTGSSVVHGGLSTPASIGAVSDVLATDPLDVSTVGTTKRVFIKTAGAVAGDTVVFNGTIWVRQQPNLDAEIAGSALAIGTPLYRAASGKALTVDGSETAIRYAFMGLNTTAAAADTDPISVASLGAVATGLGPLTVGKGYYVSGAVVGMSPMLLFSQDALATFLAGAPALSWYRFLGTAKTTTSIKEAWGEPQQV